MADTIRERIITAFAARAAILSNLPVERAQRSIGEGNERFVSIWDGDEQAQAPNYGQQVLQFSIAIESIWKHGADNPSVAANALMGEIISTMLNADRTYAGIANKTALSGASPRYPEDGSDYTTLTVIFNISYTTVMGDPYTVPVY